MCAIILDFIVQLFFLALERFINEHLIEPIFIFLPHRSADVNRRFSAVLTTHRSTFSRVCECQVLIADHQQHPIQADF